MTTNNSLEVSIGGERVNISPAILDKYNQPGPRYTSYPTAPEWNDLFGPADYREAIESANNRTDTAPLSLYVHLPFCQSLCLYCGCNVVISKNREVANPYLDRLFREVEWMSAALAPGRKVEQIHWGGGTPTYISAGQIKELFDLLAKRFAFSEDAEIGIEIDPRATTREQCRVLRSLGFNRISLGIQDFDPLVQKTVHRIQPFEMTKGLFDHCRELGFNSINIDLIYGLPHQTAESFADTVDKIILMRPDRIAVFSYAHVPWMKKQQGSFARHLPVGFEKFRIFHRAIEKLTEAGYRYIGMDHFAWPDDELCRAQDDRTLHRNFQGYTTKAGCDLFGFGVSSISGLSDVYAQNWRDLIDYYQAIDEGRWPTMRGVRVTGEDRLRRSVINRILCHAVVLKSEVERDFGIEFDRHFAPELEQLKPMERDGLVRLDVDRIEVAGLGRIFIRNVAMTFDAYLKDAGSQKRQVFSKTL
ncbi:MAG TPA: oxygen-independent coproporphyrinogen III oxidase [Blastocatellia bacterium]|nr:oxygen-independent coproporphyrinogen III oxidase [Blastocatellia bacterium]